MNLKHIIEYNNTEPGSPVDIYSRCIFESLFEIGINRFLKKSVEALAAH